MIMNKEKVFAWIESLEDMADQSDRYFVERTELYKENQAKEKEITIMKKYFQMIIYLGYDYDGFNNVEDLKGLIDALCKYASLGKECNTTEPIYINGNKKYNILGKELDGDDNE